MSRFDASKDYYSILGAGEDASAGDIERLYRRKAVEHHPDRGGDEEEMKSLNEAYGVLKDESARRAYDAERRGAAADAAEAVAAPPTVPPLQVEAAAAQSLGAVLFIGAGLVLALLVRFQWFWFLWPLAVLALALVAVGVLMAHGAIRRLEDRHSVTRSWFGATLEVMFWAVLVCGGYWIYLVLR
ncbi:MAG TPA: J domain-containing protein [Pyrinomonadaceae bacterium]|nr:J domain-containing protein [Pyrinomonadaceae bacterium]